MAEREYVRDEAGKFAETGGGGGTPGAGASAPGFPVDSVLRDDRVNDTEENRHIRDEHDEYGENVIEERAKGAIYDYIARGSYSQINQELRAHPKQFAELFAKNSPGDLSGLQSDMAHIQNAIMEAPSIDGLVLYRQTDLPPKAEAKLDTPGAVLKLAGFHSTSESPTTATGFGGKYLLEIRARQGLLLRESAEREVLLPHGAKFRVVGRRRVDVLANPGRVYTKRLSMTVIQLEQISI